MNEDPNFERRLLLAFSLSVLLFALVMWLNPKKPAPSGPTPVGAAKTATPPPTPAPTVGAARPQAANTPAASPTASKTATHASATAAPVAATAEQLETVDTPVFHVELSNQGAAVRSWQLKEYNDENGHPLDMVDAAFAASRGYPLLLWNGDAGLRVQLAQALYTVRRTTAADGSQTIVFEWAAGGVHATKTLIFDRSYEVRVSSQVTRDGQPVPAGLSWPGGFADRAAANDFATEQLALQLGDKVETLAPKKVNNGTILQGGYRLAGVEDQFFAAIYLPQDENATVSITTFKNSYRPPWTAPAAGGAAPAVDTIGLAMDSGDHNDFRLFVGPKKHSVLLTVDPALNKLVDFGFFNVIAEPLFLWMNWTYQHWIHNYGWVIVFITLVLMMAMFPLRLRAQKSQAKMMAIQPKVNALNAKMKKYPLRDPRRQEVQQEIMKLYGEHGINPLGGCIPMLLQLPLIWAFYEVLRNAIELRDAGWIGYLHDLSSKDPYYILPLLVVVSQFVTMQYMPMTPGQDPRQARMMKFMMPLFMGYIFFYFPAGVNLYYLTSNLINTGQQLWINKIYGLTPVKVDKATGKKR